MDEEYVWLYFYGRTGKCFLKCFSLRKVVFSITPLGFYALCYRRNYFQTVQRK